MVNPRQQSERRAALAIFQYSPSHHCRRWLKLERFFYCLISLTILSSFLLITTFPSQRILLRRWYSSPCPSIPNEVFHSAEVFKKNYVDMESNFKVFVYPIVGQSFGRLKGKYASEGYFFKNIQESEFLTRDPDKAHLFFIPISPHELRLDGRSYKDIPFVVGNYVDNLISKYPYWNRTLGADHFFLTCHDIGLNALAEVRLLVKNSISVVCSSSYNSDYIPHKDISLPPIKMPLPDPSISIDTVNRTRLAFWAGRANSKLRKELVLLGVNDAELDVQNSANDTATMEGHTEYAQKFYTSKYCICPRGPKLYGARIVEAIHYGCVPVILADYYDLPFNDVLDWKKFSVIIKEKDVHDLKKILKNIPSKKLREMQRNTVKVKRHFQWNSPPRRFDTFHMVMYELWLRHQVSKY